MKALVGACLAIVCGTAACGGDGPPTHTLHGHVSGLWDGAGGIALDLIASKPVLIGRLLAVPGNGAFEFPDGLQAGSSYALTIETEPSGHRCDIVQGNAGVVGDTDVTNIEVVCHGPDVGVAFAGHEEWAFDDTQDSQSYDATIFTEGVALTVLGDTLTGATINGASAVIGKPSSPAPLAAGATQVALNVTSGVLSKTFALTFHRGAIAPAQALYGKSSRTEENGALGSAMALDGDTLAIGAPGETAPAADGSATAQAGAVYVFVRSGDTWIQQARLTAPGFPSGVTNLDFGISVALSGDTLAVGAPGDTSNATGIDGDPGNLLAVGSGAVHVFVRSGATWGYQAYVKASNTGFFDQFGSAVALSGDTLAVGALHEASTAVGVNPPGQDNNDALSAGAVYVLRRTGTAWAQEAYIKPSTTRANATFGWAVALDHDTLAVSTPNESSAAAGIGGDESDTSAPSAGAAYVFSRTGTTWEQAAYVKANNPHTGARFGTAVAVWGDTMAVGSISDAGPDAGDAQTAVFGPGAVYVYHRDAAWAPQAYLRPSKSIGLATFGISVALSGDYLAVGAELAESAADALSSPGAAYIYARTGTQWAMGGQLTASHAVHDDRFGSAVAVSGGTIAVGARQESSGAVGLNPAATSASAPKSGAFYLFH